MNNSIYDEISFLSKNLKLLYYFDLNIYYKMNILFLKIFILYNFLLISNLHIYQNNKYLLLYN